MTDNAIPTPARERSPRRKPLYRTVLAVAVAALVAAWLPFTVFYVSALNKPVQVAPIALTAGHGAGRGAGTRVVTTRTSGGQIVRTVVATAGGQTNTAAAQNPAPTPVSTRAS